MKIRLLLFLTFCSVLIGCTSQPTSIENENELLYVTEQPNGIPNVLNSVEIQSDTKRKPENGRPSIFGDLLVRLKLNPEQKVQVEKLLVNHKKCTEECSRILKAAERDVLIDAKSKEDAIKNKVKSGEITREVATKLLRELKEKTKEALKTIPERIKVKECITTCDSTFLSQLKALLTPEQLVILDKWQADKRKRG